MDVCSAFLIRKNSHRIYPIFSRRVLGTLNIVFWRVHKAENMSKNRHSNPKRNQCQRKSSMFSCTDLRIESENCLHCGGLLQIRTGRVNHEFCIHDKVARKWFTVILNRDYVHSWSHFGSRAILAHVISLEQHIAFGCVEVFVCSVCVDDGLFRWAVARDGAPSKSQEGGYRWSGDRAHQHPSGLTQRKPSAAVQKAPPTASSHQLYRSAHWPWELLPNPNRTSQSWILYSVNYLRNRCQKMTNRHPQSKLRSSLEWDVIFPQIVVVITVHLRVIESWTSFFVKFDVRSCQWVVSHSWGFLFHGTHRVCVRVLQLPQLQCVARVAMRITEWSSVEETQKIWYRCFGSFIFSVFPARTAQV